MRIRKYWWAIVAFMGFSAFAVAHILEVYGQWPACRLCHIERKIFLVMGAMALLRIILTHVCSSKSWGKFLGSSITITSVLGAVTAAYHTSIQFHWIGLPTFCRLPEADTFDQFMALPTATCDQWTMTFLSLPAPLYLFFLWTGVAYLTWRFLKEESLFDARQHRPYF